MESSVKKIRTIPFSEFFSWDFKSYTSSIFSFNYPTAKLKEVLSKPNIEWVSIENDKTYPILGVRAQGKGVYINRIAVGKELTMKKYQKSKSLHLFYCKVRTVGGQWGVVYPEFENSYGSSNMQYLKIDLSKILPEYIELLLKIKKLTDLWDLKAIGADGRHFTLSTLLDLEIPLPSISVQKIIINAYKHKIKLAEEQKGKGIQLKIEIQEYLDSSLKIKSNEQSQINKGLQFIKFKDISRWDSLFLIGNIPSIDSKYPLRTFESVINCFNKGENGKSIRINSKEFPNESFRYIGMEHIEKDSGVLLELNEVKGKEIKSQTLRVPYNYLIFGKLRPYLNKYWLNDTDFDNIICSSEFFVFDVTEDVDRLFFKYVLSSNFIQAQIADKSSGARMPRINESIFYNLKFPLPKIEAQKEIASKISQMLNQIESLNNQSEVNINEALAEFEKQIFEQ